MENLNTLLNMKTIPTNQFGSTNTTKDITDRTGSSSLRPTNRIPAAIAIGMLGAVAALGWQANLTVNISPPEAVAAGAGWRLLGEAVWRNSGIAYTNLPLGVHFLEFRPVDGWIAAVEDRPVVIEELTSIVMFGSYRLVPIYPVFVTSTAGGFVQEEPWLPFSIYGLRPPGSVDPATSGNLDWDRAFRESQLRYMPRENSGWRVQLRAMAFPGYQFVGWSGDVTGTRNPLTFIVPGPQRIQAHFARPSTWIAATQLADYYYTPGFASIHGQFSFPVGDRLQLLKWRPKLPPRWKLTGVSGLGGPLIRGTEVVFEGLLGYNPIQFNLSVEVPGGETGAKEVLGEVEYALLGNMLTNTQPVSALTVVAQASPAARLRIDVSRGQPLVSIQGVVGQTYTLEQSYALLPERYLNWWFMSDVTLTNSPQLWVDPMPLAAGGNAFYRATILK
jgi:uncharacterized repeat protein (TIGR02543 family)